MKMRIYSWTASVTCVFCTFVATASFSLETPPSPREIFDTMELHWKNREFVEFDSYVAKLNERFPGYVPAIVAHAVREFHRGEQFELMNRVLGDLLEKLGAYPASVPKSYLDALRIKIRFQERRVESLLKKNESPAIRLERYAPEKLFTADGLAFQFLIVTAPTVSFPKTPGSELLEHRIARPHAADLDRLTPDELVSYAMYWKRPLEQSEAAIERLVALTPGHSLPYLAEIIEDKGSNGLAGTVAANYIERGTAENPNVLADILERTLFGHVREDAIYGMMRIGRLTPEVRSALEGVASKSFLLDEYAKEALHYLEQNQTP